MCMSKTAMDSRRKSSNSNIPWDRGLGEGPSSKSRISNALEKIEEE